MSYLNELLGTAENSLDSVYINPNNFNIMLKESDAFVMELFNNAENKFTSQCENLFNSLFDAFPFMAALYEGLKQNETLRIVFSDEVMQKISSGEYHLMKSTENFLKAVAVDEKNHIRELGCIVTDNVPQGINLYQLASAMQAAAIKKELKKISEQLKEMDHKLNMILAGQHTDRKALYLAGEMLCKEAMVCADPLMRKSLIYNALLSVTQGAYQLEEAMQTDITELKAYDAKNKGMIKSKDQDMIADILTRIKESLEFIHKATYLKVAVYVNENQYPAAIASLTGYKTFLEQHMDKKQTELLFKFDTSEARSDKFWAPWHSMPNTIAELCSRVESTEYYYLEKRKDNE